MSDHSLNESLWRRGRDDATSIYKGLPFIIFVAVGCPLIAGIIEWYWGLILLGSAGFLVWLGATGAAPIKQRNEARRRVLELEVRKEEAIQNKRIANAVGTLIIEGTEVLKAFNTVDSSNSKWWPIEEFKSWQGNGTKIFTDFRLTSEYVLWFRDVSIDISNPVLNDFKNACQAGLYRLEKILDKFGT